jgi:hypothetical protein
MRTKGRFLLAQKAQGAHQRRFSLVVLAAQFAKIGKIYNKWENQKGTNQKRETSKGRVFVFWFVETEGTTKSEVLLALQRPSSRKQMGETKRDHLYRHDLLKKTAFTEQLMSLFNVRKERVFVFGFVGTVGTTESGVLVTLVAQMPQKRLLVLVAPAEALVALEMTYKKEPV